MRSMNQITYLQGVVWLIMLTCITAKPAPEDDNRARLLISKQLLNKYSVQSMDTVIKYSIHNVGNNPAIDIQITDAGYEPDMFQVVAGQVNATFHRIPPQKNVTHIVILRPIKFGMYNFTAAEITYRPSEESDLVQIGYSSSPGEIKIDSFMDYHKKFSSHVCDWLMFGILTLPSLVIPFGLWYKSKVRYENVIKTLRKGK